MQDDDGVKDRLRLGFRCLLSDLGAVLDDVFNSDGLSIGLPCAEAPAKYLLPRR